MELSLDQRKDGTVAISVTASTKNIADIKADALIKLGQGIEIKGFRKGNAPIKMVEKHIKTEALVEEILNLLINRAYLQAIKQHEISPIADPIIILPDLKNKPPKVLAHEVLWPKMQEEGLRFSIKAFAEPKVELGNWQEAVKKLEGEKDEAKIETVRIVDALVEEADIAIPKELVEREVNRRLYYEAQATAETGMRFEDYLKSQGDSLDDYRDRVRVEAEHQLKIRFILPKIAQELNVKLGEAQGFEKLLDELKGVVQGA